MLGRRFDTGLRRSLRSRHQGNPGEAPGSGRGPFLVSGLTVATMGLALMGLTHWADNRFSPPTPSPIVVRHVVVLPAPTPEPIPPSSAQPEATPSPANPPPTPSPVRGPSTPIEARFRAAWPGDDEAALRVARCESGLNPRATGAAGERGLMQIHPIHRARIRAMGLTWAQMYDVEPNLAVAWALYRQSGWRPWACQP